MYHIGALAGFAAEVLAEQIGDFAFVIQDQNACATRRLPEKGKLTQSGHSVPKLRHPCWWPGNLRVSRMVNSVKPPTLLSTAIVPPCCWVTMS
jgi:hypothetical protein